MLPFFVPPVALPLLMPPHSLQKPFVATHARQTRAPHALHVYNPGENLPQHMHRPPIVIESLI